MSRIVVLADTITPFALSALKYGLFALLFLFIWRSMRWVVRGLNVDGARPPRNAAADAPATPRPTLPPGPSTLLVQGSRTRSRGR